MVEQKKLKKKRKPRKLKKKLKKINYEKNQLKF
jgi:hypothetical protein